VVTKFPNLIGALAFCRRPGLCGAAKSATEFFQVRAKLLKLRTEFETWMCVLNRCLRERLRENQLGNGYDFFPILVGSNQGQSSRERVKHKPISTRESKLCCLRALQDMSERWIVICTWQV
jgi:hypothetical protein